MQESKKNNLILSILLILICSAFPALNSSDVKAAYYNLGSLDVQPIVSESTQNKNWFVEYLKPNQSIQEQLRISNFSPTEKNLEIYVADTIEQQNNEEKNSKFFTHDKSEKQEDINSWTRLPIQKLTLQGGESRIISVNLNLPKNAGVGLHSGAIIVREKTADNVYMEKGVRIYLNVIGPIINKTQINNANLKENINSYSFLIKTANLGTVDYKTNYQLELISLFGEYQKSETIQEKVRPQTIAESEIKIEKPAFGVFKLKANLNGTTSELGTIIIIPFWTIFFGFFTALAFAKPRFRKFKNKLFKSPELILDFIKEFQLVKSVTYFGLFSLVAAGTVYFSSFNPGEIKTQILKPKASDSYELTVKWGNFRNLTLPAGLKQSWKGELTVSDGTLSTKQLIDFEQNDNSQIIDNNRTLKFNIESGPNSGVASDNDAMILKITPNSDTTPKITYLNSKTKEKITFDIADFINSPGIFPNGLFAIYFKTAYSPDNAAPELINEFNTTAEASSTPELKADIPQLKNLFVEDLPSTPEVLADFVLKSDYVEKISNDNKLAKIETDPILIEALSATPEVLMEIASTPDLNYIFVPSDTVHFPPQEFSFDQSNTATQDLGTLIFVHNKDVPWNTYIGTTNFTSLSKKATIPASALTIIPGEADLLSKDSGITIEPGAAKTFSSTSDKSVLVDVKSNNDKDALFELNPVLEIRIPPGTLPGRYQGSLTITSL